MWSYEKRLQYPVKITTPNAKIAQIIMSQYGGTYCTTRWVPEKPSKIKGFPAYKDERSKCYHRVSRQFLLRWIV